MITNLQLVLLCTTVGAVGAESLAQNRVGAQPRSGTSIRSISLPAIDADDVPPRDGIVPMALPGSTDHATTSDPLRAGRVVTLDQRRRTTTVSRPSPHAPLVSQWEEPLAGVASPHSTNPAARLVMAFRTRAGDIVHKSCSGAFVDYRTIITAGHCVFDRSADVLDWATDVWVQVETGSAIQSSRSSALATFSGWIDDGDSNYDLAFVRVDRPLGALTGTLGYGYDDHGKLGATNPDWNRLLSDSPTFDGMGGTVQVDGGTGRFALGVASASDRTNRASYTSLWQGAFEHLRDAFIPTGRTAGWDLQVLDVKADATRITAGQGLHGVRFAAINHGHEGVSGTHRFLLVLSSGAGQSALGNYEFTTALASADAVQVDIGTVEIPVGTPGGYLLLGAVLDVEDGLSENNAGSFADTHPILVTPVLEPEAVLALAADGPHRHGEAFSLHYAVRNNGAVPAEDVIVDIRLSDNPIVTRSDLRLGTVELKTIEGRTTVADSFTVDVPETLVGEFYVGFIVTTSGRDVVRSNNIVVDPVPVTFSSRVNLEARRVEAADGEHFQTASVNVSHSVHNDSPVASGNYSVEVRLSSDAKITESDLLLRSDDFVSLAADASREANVRVRIPAALAPGTWYVGTIVSTGPGEIDIEDNVDHDSFPIRVLPCHADWNNDGAINSADLVAFVRDYNSTLAGGSWRHGDPDIGVPFGTRSSGDLLAFLNFYSDGCD